MVSRRDTEKDVRCRQTERWRQKTRRQKQRTERQTKRTVEITEREVQGDKRGREVSNERNEELRRSTRERRAKIDWCIWCGVGCRGEEGGRCKERRQRRDKRRQKLYNREVLGPTKGSGDDRETKTSTLNPSREGGTEVERVGEGVPLNTQTSNLEGDRLSFKGGKLGGEEGQPRENRGRGRRSTRHTGEGGEREDKEGSEIEEKGMTENVGDKNLENS